MRALMRYMPRRIISKYCPRCGGRMFLDGKDEIHCINCGYILEGTKAPEKCPACAHPQSYFELLGENW